MTLEPNPGYYSILEHALQDATMTRSGERTVISKQMLYVELNSDGNAYFIPNMHLTLDYRPLKENEPSCDTILKRLSAGWKLKN